MGITQPCLLTSKALSGIFVVGVKNNTGISISNSSWETEPGPEAQH